MMHNRLRWLPWVILAASVLGALYSAAGYMMAGSFAVSNPEHLEQRRSVASAYGALLIACLVIAATASAYVIRMRAAKRQGQRPDINAGPPYATNN